MATPKLNLPPGFSFSPGDANIVSLLCSKIAHEPLHAAIGQLIHDADVYAAEAPQLVAGFAPASSRTGDSWYFYSFVKSKSSRDSRKCRSVAGGKGTWHSEKAGIDVLDVEGRIVGYRQSFTYITKDGGKPGWLMMEFGLNQEDEEARRGCEPMPVLCKIYQTTSKKHSAPNSSSARSGSKRKREVSKRSTDIAPSARVRRQLQFSSSPAPNRPPAEGTTSECPDNFLIPVEPQQQPQPETEESPLARHIHFMRNYRATTSTGERYVSWTELEESPMAQHAPSVAQIDEGSTSFLGGMEFVDDFPMPVDPQPELETFNNFFSPDHTRSMLSCYDSTPSCAPVSAPWTLGHVVAACTQH